MSEEAKETNKLKITFKDGLLLTVLIFALCFEHVISLKFIYGIGGNNQSWNTWEYAIISGLIMAIVGLVAMYFAYGRRK
jgi:hypothetical protein